MELVLRPGGAKAGGEDPAARIQKLIRRKLSEKGRLEAELVELQRELSALVPGTERARELAGEVHALLDEAVRRPGLTRRQRLEIASLHEELEDDLLGPDPASEGSADEAPCDCPYCSGDFEEEERYAGWEPGMGPEVGAAAGAPRGAGREPGLRDLYHALALQVHPDRAGDDALRAEHAEKMRQINDAFHGGDTDRLLELSRELGIETSALRNARGVLAELVEQYERVKAEVRALRDSPPGRLVVDTRRARRGRRPTPLEVLASELEEHLAALVEVRDFVARFVAAELSVDELLAGPGAPDEDEEDPLAVLIALMGGALDAAPPRKPRPRPPAPRRNRRRRR